MHRSSRSSVVAAVVIACAVGASLQAQQPSPIQDGFGKGAYRPGRGIDAPVMVRAVQPQYTADALRAKVEGEVTLEAIIGPDGLVTDTRIVKSLDPDLDRNAESAARQWTFKPASLDGRPVPVVVALFLQFRLHPSPTAASGAPAAAPATPQTSGRSASAGADDEFAKGAYPASTAGLVKPVATSAPEPKYTSQAMRAKIQGDVLVDAVVLPDGTVGQVRVAKSLDATMGLDEEALAAARNWTFRPGTLKGEAVPVLVRLALTFRLH